MKRKALYSVICTVLILLLAAALLVACNDGVSETYTLSFRDGTEVIARVELQSGESLQASDIPEAPFHADENFVGWFIGIKEITAGYTPERSGVVVAKYEKIIKYTATFDMGGAPGDAPADVTVVENNSIQLPSVSWVGHAFLGWKLGEEPLHLADESYVMTGDVAFVAQWQEVDYTVTFSLGGAPGEDPATQHCHYGDAIKLPDAPVWAEHTFLGWYDEAGEKKDAEDEITIQDNISFTAHWQSDHSASEFVGVWMSANNYGYVVVTAAGADAFDVKGYVVGAYEAFEAQDVAYDGALGQFVVTIYKAANQQQAENVAFSISDGKLRAAGSSISPVTFDHQTDDTLAGYYLYHDAEDEVLEVVAGGLIVTNTAKLFGATQPVFAYIASDGADGYKLVYKHRTDSRAAELSGSQFEVTEDGNLHVHIADTCKLFVKGATAGESFDGPDGAKLYKYTTVEGDVYAFRADATSDIVLATIEGTVAEGEEFTITYGEWDDTQECKLVGGSIIFAGKEAGEYVGFWGTLILDGFGEGTLDGEDITYTLTDDYNKVIINGATFILDSYDRTYSVAESDFAYGEYHNADSSVTLTYTINDGKKVIIISGGENPGTFEVKSSYHYDAAHNYVKYIYISVNGEELEWHYINNILYVMCVESDGASEYVGEYTLDHILEPDIYPVAWTGTWESDEDNVKVRITTKQIYIWGPNDEDWVQTTFYSKYSAEDFYLMYKGEQIDLYRSSSNVFLTLTDGPFNYAHLYLKIFGEDMLGNYQNEAGWMFFIETDKLRIKQGDSVESATEIVEKAENDFTFTYNGESYRIWKDGDQLKLSKADGTEEQILTVAELDGKQGIYRGVKSTSYTVTFDGYGNAVIHLWTDYPAIYTIDDDGNYIISGCSQSEYNGTWTVSDNGYVITNEEGDVYEKEAVIDIANTDYGIFLLGNSLILHLNKWSVAISTPAHNEFEETYDITVNAGGTYTFTLLGVTYTLGGYNNNLTLNGSALTHFTAVFDVLKSGFYYYAYHNIVYIYANDVVTNNIWFEGSELKYSVVMKDETLYNIKIEDGDPIKYYAWYNEEWMLLSDEAEEEYSYPHGVWQLEGGDTKITISGLVGNNVGYNFAVEGGSSATTSATWNYVQKGSSDNNKQFTVNINGTEYTVGGYGQVLLITGDGDLAGLYDHVGDVVIDFFTEEWFGQWTTIDYKHTINIIDSHTVQYKGEGDSKFYDTEVSQNYVTNFEKFNITIKGGVNADNKWVIEYTAMEGMKFGESDSYATTQMYKDIFPHNWVDKWQSDDGQYVNIYVDHVVYAAANSPWVALKEHQSGDKDFNLTFGDDVYRLYEEGGALKLSKGGSAHTLTKRAADKLAGRNYVDEDAYWRIFEFDGYGNVEYNGYIGTYYIDVDEVTVHITFGNDSLDGAYTLSEHDHVLTNEDGDNYAETSFFAGLEGIYIGEGVIIVLGKYSVIIATNEYTTSEEVIEMIIDQNDEGKEYHFNAFGTPYVLTNASGSLTLDSIALTKVPGKLYANDNVYTVGFSGTAITFNKKAVEAYTVSFVDGKPTISFTVEKVAYTITKGADVYKISANDASYDMSTTPVTPATIFGTWTKDNITWTFAFDGSRSNTGVYLTVTGGDKEGTYDVTATKADTDVTRNVTIDVAYSMKISGQVLIVTGEGAYAGTYTKAATTEPEIIDEQFTGVWTKDLNGTVYYMIVTKQHMWIRDKNDKGGGFEDFYDIIPWSGQTSYTDIAVYWVSVGKVYNIWGYGEINNATEFRACGNVTSPEQFIAWELAN